MRRSDDIRFKDADIILKRNGFVQTSCNGSHQKYERDNRHIVICRLGVNKMMWKRLCREYGIRLEK